MEYVFPGLLHIPNHERISEHVEGQDEKSGAPQTLLKHSWGFETFSPPVIRGKRDPRHPGPGIPLTPLAVEAFQRQMVISGDSPFLFPSDHNRSGHQTTFKTVWRKTLRRAKVPYFRIYDLRSTYATRLSAGGVADEWVTQMLRQGDAQVFKKYSQMKLQMKCEALEKLNRRASEMAPAVGERMRTVMVQ